MGDADFLHGRRVAFLGKLGSMNRREAQALLRRFGALPTAHDAGPVDLLIVGADAWPLEAETMLNQDQRAAVADGRLELLSETGFWERLGLLDPELAARRFYTPAMLADLLHVSVRVIRGWTRRGLIQPVRELHRLPYFDFQEVVTARKLAQMVAAGVSAATLQHRLQQLSHWLPGIDRPLAQLSIIAEGRSLLLRSAGGLIDHRGQRHFEFDHPDAARANDLAEIEDPTAEPPIVEGSPPSLLLPWVNLTPDEPWQQYVAQAESLEEDGFLMAAVDAYRGALLAGGPRSDVNFALAELLYRSGDLAAARERYLCAIELEPDFVEARANLACVLFEEGSPDLAVSALQGALKHHPDFPDAHYFLARFLDQMQRAGEAREHWRTFLKLAPDSPWADEAQQRLELPAD